MQRFILVAVLPSFAERGGAGYSVGLCSVLENSTGCLGEHGGHWHNTGSAILLQEMCWEGFMLSEF